MANDLSNTLQTSVQVFYSTLGDHISNFRRWSRPINESAPIVQRADLYGVGDFAAQSAVDPTADDLDSNANTVTRAVYEKLVTVNEVDLKDRPALATEITAMLAERAAYKVNKTMYAALAAVDTTAHPAAADYTATGGGSVYFADSFATPVDQDNLFTAALSASSLETVIAAAHNYKTKDSLEADVARELVLVAPPALRSVAMDLSSSTEAIYDGSGLQYRFGDVVRDVVISPMLSDANDWFLVSRVLSPIKHWIRDEPNIRVTLDPKAGRVHFYASVTCNAVLEPWEGGLFMSKVA